MERNERLRKTANNEDIFWSAWGENRSLEARWAGFLKESARKPGRLGGAKLVECRKWVLFGHLPLFEIKDGEKKRRRKKDGEIKDGDKKTAKIKTAKKDGGNEDGEKKTAT